MDSPHNALDEALHRYGYLFIELPILYPKLVLEPFITGPLQEKHEKKAH